MSEYKKICRHCKKEFTKPRKVGPKRWLTRFCCSPSCGQKSKDFSHMRKLFFKKGDNAGNKNHNWKGDDVGIEAIHAWVSNNFGKADFCESLTCNKTSFNFHWSNKSGKYLRERNDWVKLCASCHKIEDITNPKPTSQKALDRAKKLLVKNGFKVLSPVNN